MGLWKKGFPKRAGILRLPKCFTTFRTCFAQDDRTGAGDAKASSEWTRPLARPGFVSLSCQLVSLSCLEDKFRTELERARAVGSVGSKEVPWGSLVVIHATPLGVIEHVKCLGTELEPTCLRELEMLKQGHVEVRGFRVSQAVSARVSEGQAGRSGVSGGV